MALSDKSYSSHKSHSSATSDKCDNTGRHCLTNVTVVQRLISVAVVTVVTKVTVVQRLISVTAQDGTV
jgi:hypothetical protein